MTVSNAFNRPEELSADLRQCILSTAANAGYHGPRPSGPGHRRHSFFLLRDHQHFFELAEIGDHGHRYAVVVHESDDLRSRTGQRHDVGAVDGGDADGRAHDRRVWPGRSYQAR